MGDRIKKMQPGYWITLTMFCVPFVYRLLHQYCNFQFYKTHICVGVMAAFLLLLMIVKPQWIALRGKEVKWLLAAILLFFSSTIFGQLFNFQSPLYYFWGLRNNGRYFIFFFSCIAFLKAEQRDCYWKVLDTVFWAHVAVSLYQFLVLGIRQDFLNGIFGTMIGNGETHIFQLLVVTTTLTRYMYQRESGWYSALKCGSTLLVAAIAEIKVFFLEFAAIVILLLLMTKFSRRKLYILIGGAIGLVVGLQLLSLIFPGWAGWFHPAFILETLTSKQGYTGQGDWNRLTAAPIAWNDFLLTFPQKLFGLGLGNCDFGPAEHLASSFYPEHVHLNYSLFSSGMIMLETGLVGFLTYIGFFVTLFVASWSLEHRGKSDPMYCQMGKLLAFVCLELFIYDGTLRTECGIMLYFACAMPFLGSGTAKSE